MARAGASRAALAPLGHHTHWGGPAQARPQGEVDAAAVVRDGGGRGSASTASSRGFFCGGGWYFDLRFAETLASFGYVDCTATTLPPAYLAADRRGCSCPDRAGSKLPSGASLLELPATHSLGHARARPARLPALVHLHFHDWELVDRKRALALEGLLRLLSVRRRPLRIDQLAERAAAAPELAWDGGYDRPVTTPEDVRAAQPYLFSRSPLKTFARRLASIARARSSIDVAGLTLGLYLALALRALVFDPKPILWGLLWDHETDWLPFLILLLVLVFWRAGLYAPRELREGAGRIVPSVVLVAALALAFAVGTGQHFTTFGLYVVGAVFVAVADQPSSAGATRW